MLKPLTTRNELFTVIIGCGVMVVLFSLFLYLTPPICEMIYSEPCKEVWRFQVSYILCLVFFIYAAYVYSRQLTDLQRRIHELIKKREYYNGLLDKHNADISKYDRQLQLAIESNDQAKKQELEQCKYRSLEEVSECRDKLDDIYLKIIEIDEGKDAMMQHKMARTMPVPPAEADTYGLNQADDIKRKLVAPVWVQPISAGLQVIKAWFDWRTFTKYFAAALLLPIALYWRTILIFSPELFAPARLSIHSGWSYWKIFFTGELPFGYLVTFLFFSLCAVLFWEWRNYWEMTIKCVALSLLLPAVIYWVYRYITYDPGTVAAIELVSELGKPYSEIYWSSAWSSWGGILTFTSVALFGLLYAVNNAGRVLASIVTVLIAVTMLALARIGWWDFYVIAIVEYCIFIAVFLNIPPVKTVFKNRGRGGALNRV